MGGVGEAAFGLEDWPCGCFGSCRYCKEAGRIADACPGNCLIDVDYGCLRIQMKLMAEFPK